MPRPDGSIRRRVWGVIRFAQSADRPSSARTDDSVAAGVSIRVRRLLLPLLVLGAAALVAAATGTSDAPAASRDTTEVVVQLTGAPLAYDGSRAARARVDAAQQRFVAALRSHVPHAHVRWRYRIVTNGLAVVLPRRELAGLQKLPGVKQVFYGFCLLLVVMFVPDGVWPPLARVLGLDRASKNARGPLP